MMKLFQNFFGGLRPSTPPFQPITERLRHFFNQPLTNLQSPALLHRPLRRTLKFKSTPQARRDCLKIFLPLSPSFGPSQNVLILELLSLTLQKMYKIYCTKYDKTLFRLNVRGGAKVLILSLTNFLLSFLFVEICWGEDMAYLHIITYNFSGFVNDFILKRIF